MLDQANGNSTATLPGTVSSCGNGSVISSLNQTMANTAAGAVPAGAASLSPPVTRPVRRVAKLLSITLALPNPTEEELMYKRGKGFQEPQTQLHSWQIYAYMPVQILYTAVQLPVTQCLITARCSSN